MEIKQIIFLVISLSSLFSISASRPSTPLSPSSAPTSYPNYRPASSPQAQGNDDLQTTFNILPEGADPRLQQICGNTDHPIECVKMAAPLLQKNVAIEPLKVLEVGVQTITNTTKEALAEATELLLDPTIEEKLAACLETCVDSYNDILDGNQKVIDAITVQDSYMLNMQLSANMENVHTCSDAFSEAKLESPVKQLDSLIGKTISNSLAIGVEMVHF